MACDELPGLNIDMLDVDRLRQWAVNVETYGADLTQWAYPQFLVEELRRIADGMEAEVRAVGVLRERARVSERNETVAKSS